MKGRRPLLALGLAALVTLALAGAAPAAKQDVADHGGRPLSTTLTGTAEVPGPGDPDGSGMAGFVHRLLATMLQERCACGLYRNHDGSTLHICVPSLPHHVHSSYRLKDFRETRIYPFCPNLGKRARPTLLHAGWAW